MASELDNDEICNNEYYSLLNIKKEATQKELKDAYRQLCLRYHPDKHREPELKQQAEQSFHHVHRAYKVLSDPHTRAIYDLYGQRGLDLEGWEVVERQRTQQEIQDEYEYLQRRREEKLLEQSTKPKTMFSVHLDATRCFAPHGEDLVDNCRHLYESLLCFEMNRMHVSQSIEAPLTTKDTAILSGSLWSNNGKGEGNFYLGLRRFASTNCWGQLMAGMVGSGDTHGPFLGLYMFKQLTADCFLTAWSQLYVSSQGLSPYIVTECGRKLDKNTAGYLRCGWGMKSSMKTSIVRDTERTKFTCAAKVGMPDTYLMLGYHYKFQDENKTTINISLKAGLLFGTVVEYGATTRISRHSVLGVTVSVGVLQGVSLKIHLNRASQGYFFPIRLTSELLPGAVFYATVGPLVFYLVLRKLVIQPYMRAQKEQVLEEDRARSSSDIARRRREAESYVLLMRASVQRMIEAEESKMGLVIHGAWYGRFVPDDINNNNNGKHERASTVIDVTVPLQCLVKDSKLLLTEVTKSGLPGFYDPCVGEDKSLKVVYQFRAVMHQVMSGDTEPIRIPMQSHRVETSDVSPP